MYGSRGRGGSRGRSGHWGRSFTDRGHDGAGRRGPALPLSLLRELGGDDDSSMNTVRGRGGDHGGGGRSAGGVVAGRGRGRGRDSGGRGNCRASGGIHLNKPLADWGAASGVDPHRASQGDDVVRSAKRQRLQRNSHNRDGSGGALDHRGGGLTRTLAAMEQRQSGSGSGVSGSGSRAGSSSKSKFHELLVDGWESRNGREAFLEELRLQARLAKKLGKKSKKEALDGMDKLTGFLSAGTGSLLPKYLDPESRQQAEDLLAKTGSGTGEEDVQQAGLGLKALSKGAATSAALAARQAAELMDRESDEELGFFGIDPGSRGDDDDDGTQEGSDDDDDRHDAFHRNMSDGLISGSGSESLDDDDDDEGEEDGGDLNSGGDSDDEMDLEGVDDESEDEDEDEYDVLGQLMGSESEEEKEEEEEREEEEEQRPVVRRHQEQCRDGSPNGSGGSDGDSEDGTEEEDESGDAEEERKGTVSTSTAEVSSGQKYLPPALRTQLAAAAASAAGGAGGGADAARVQVERRVTGLINRLAESNLQSISREVADLYGKLGRRLVSDAVAAQILGAAETGPRASEQFAAVAAAFVTAVAAQAEAQDLAAGFMAALAERLERARNSDDSLAQANLATLLAYCYSAGLVGAGLCYSLLNTLKERFQEADVAAMVTLLNAIGLQLRNADPGLMKEFVLGVHERAAQLGRDGQLSRRAQLMLDLIIDIKNNKTSISGGAAAAAAAPNVCLGGTATRQGKGAAAAAGAGGGGRRGGSLAVLQPSVAKWLQQIGSEEVCLRGLTWPKLMAPNKKGMWWMPVAGEALDDPLLQAATAGTDTTAVATTSAASSGSATTAKLLQLAAAQRMNTDARRSVFVAIMGSEDCAEAHERLLRLPLKGDQRREIVRVLVDCCLREKSWNPYYAFLALRLCGGGEAGGARGGGSVGRAHRVTLQYCLWDNFKELESMDVRQLTHLAKLAALLVAKFALSLSLLKVVDWSDLSAKEMLMWRIFLQHLLGSCNTAGDAKEIFARVAAQPKTLSELISGLLIFLRTSFAPWAATKLPTGPDSDELLRRTRLAERELAAGASAAAAVVI